MPITHSGFSDLSTFQRLLMVTDGTVTEMLEQYLQEKIQVEKLHEAVVNQIDLKYTATDCLAEYAGFELLQRKVLLQGQQTGKNWVYAESAIVLQNLPAAFQHDLLGLQAPIGRLWTKYRIETFKQILHYARFPAAELAGYFALTPDTEMLARTYAVYSGGKLIMLISEIFPIGNFGAEI